MEDGKLPLKYLVYIYFAYSGLFVRKFDFIKFGKSTKKIYNPETLFVFVFYKVYKF